MEATVLALARLPIPFLADLGAVTLPEEHGQLSKTEMAWVNPGDDQLYTASLVAAQYPADELRTAVERVLAEGSLMMLNALSVPYPPRRATAWPPPPAPIRSAVVLPLNARGRILGALTLALSNPERPASIHDMAVARDFAARAAIALDNARLYRELQEADRRKNEFLSMLAHELRNPLAPIRNGIHILRALGSSDPQTRDVREMIERQVQQMVRLVDDLLDLSRINRGKIRLQSEPVSLADVLTRAVETCRPLIAERQHRLSVAAPAGRLRVQGDAVRLAQVVGNLLNNAAKYTPQGGQIWLSAREGEEAIIRVRDNGVGIPADMLGSVFDLFTQGARTLDRSEGGLGIGLTLVRQLVELHSGQVEAQSEGPNRGSEFVVRLPLTKDKGPRTKDETDSDNSPSSFGTRASRKVLVVDDNQDAAESLAMLLEVAGHQVRPQVTTASRPWRPRPSGP